VAAVQKAVRRHIVVQVAAPGKKHMVSLEAWVGAAASPRVCLQDDKFHPQMKTAEPISGFGMKKKTMKRGVSPCASRQRHCDFGATHILVVLSVLLTAGTSPGQISIENHRSVPVPEDRAWVIYQSTCQVVAERFHVKKASELQVPFRLVVGSTDSGVLYDEGAALYEIHLRNWGDTEFAFAALRLTLQRLVSAQSRRELLRETLARAERKLPVSSGSLTRAPLHSSDESHVPLLCPSAVSVMDCLFGFGPSDRK
jgi:hypothetical protein